MLQMGFDAGGERGVFFLAIRNARVNLRELLGQLVELVIDAGNLAREEPPAGRDEDREDAEESGKGRGVERHGARYLFFAFFGFGASEATGESLGISKMRIR